MANPALHQAATRFAAPITASTVILCVFVSVSAPLRSVLLTLGENVAARVSAGAK